MDAKHCSHLKTSLEINREFVQKKKQQNQIFECLGEKSNEFREKCVNDITNLTLIKLSREIIKSSMTRKKHTKILSRTN